MSRTFVRRLAVMALLAVLCFALPAAAAAPRHTTKAPPAAPSLWNEILTWIGNFLGVPSPAGTEGRAKAAVPISQSLLPGGGQSTATGDFSGGMDPNGHS